MEQTIGNFVSAALIAVISAWIGVWFSVRRFRAEKWWEKKSDAYARIIEALHVSKMFSDKHLEAGERARDVSEEARQQLLKAATAAHNEILRVIDIGAFLLSSASLERLKKYQTEAEAASSAEGWREYLELDWAATNSCLTDLILLAKKDLGIA